MSTVETENIIKNNFSISFAKGNMKSKQCDRCKKENTKEKQMYLVIYNEHMIMCEDCSCYYMHLMSQELQKKIITNENKY